MTDCLFCRIISGEIPSTRIYEDEHTLVILDVNPIAPGHALVLTKAHCETIMDASPHQITATFSTAQKTANALIKATHSDGCNLIQNNGKAAGQLVPHLHIHVVPRKPRDGINFNWIPRPYEAGEADRIAAHIRSALQ